MEKVTSLQVAERAGVSQSAVSRVFTPGASASAKTVEKVRKAAQELGYRPNMMARAMITGKSRIIALVVAYLDNQFYPHGIITASVAMTNDLTDRCNAAGIPVVMFNRGQDGADVSSVTSANVKGGREAGQFLLDCGHKTIAHISGWQGSSTGRDRQKGFCDALLQAGMMPQLIDVMYNRETAVEATETLMAGPNPPDAIFVGNDHMAFAVMDTLRGKLGLRVPEDVAVIGYDDVPLAAWAAYDLTTMRQPLNRMVDATVEALLTRIDDPTSPTRHIEIASPLIARGSTRPRKGSRA